MRSPVILLALRDPEAERSPSLLYYSFHIYQKRYR